MEYRSTPTRAPVDELEFNRVAAGNIPGMLQELR
jgi:hypothetical protein